MEQVACAARQWASAAVSGIADQRMADVERMLSYLVLFSGDQSEYHQRGVKLRIEARRKALRLHGRAAVRCGDMLRGHHPAYYAEIVFVILFFPKAFGKPLRARQSP